MDTTGGYDFEIDGDQLVKDYECPICLLLIKEAVELPCTHALCRTCLTKWEDDPADRNAGLLCPSCKVAYQHDQVFASRFADRIITGSIKIKCKENRYGCEWTGTICEYYDHEKKCLFVSVKCIFVGCGERVSRINLEEHMKICDFRLVQCSYCGAEEQFNNLEEHHQICKSYPIVCINKECEIIMQRKKVPSHIENDCQYQIIDCQYKLIGCDVRVQRKEHHNHLHTFIQEHMEFMLTYSMHTTVRLTATEQNLETSQIEHNETKQMLQTTNVQLQKTNQKLTDTTEELHATKIILDETRKELKVTRDKLTENVKIEQKFKDDLEKKFNSITENFKKIEENTITVKEESTKVLALSTKKIVIDFKSFESCIKILPEKSWKAYKEEQFQLEIEDHLYPVRFEKLVHVMKTKKLYFVNNFNNNEIYLKVNLNIYINRTLCISMKDISQRTNLKSDVDTIYYSDEFCLYYNNHNYCDFRNIYLYFFIPDWTNGTTNAYVIHPQRDEEIQKGCSSIISASYRFKGEFREYMFNDEILIKLKNI